MTPLGLKRLAITMSVAAIAFAALAAWGWARCVMFEVHSSLTDGWSGALEDGTDTALANTNVTEVADMLRWVGRFYHSPNPPPHGIERHHYNLMERARTCYQKDIVLHLRKLTGDQLADDPKLWIKKYAKPE